MFKPFIRRPVTWILLVGLLVLAFALSACGESGPTVASTVHIKESKASGVDVYTCDPLTITIKKGDTVDFVNDSDELQDFDMGDAAKAGIDIKVPVNDHKTATFNNSGTFMIVSEKGATVMVTVS
jgi:plastocyanin